MGRIFLQSWQIYRRHFFVIAAVVAVIWLPLELLSSYMDAYVFGENKFFASVRFALFLENFGGIIATAGVIVVGYEVLAGDRPGFRSALGMGFASWGRMWWTRFLYGIALILGCLLLVVPGVWLLVRLSFVEPVAVLERLSGTDAMRRSFALTKGRFWLMVRLGLATFAVSALPGFALVAAVGFIPGLDNWVVDAAAQLVGDIVLAFGTVVFLTAYALFYSEQIAQDERGQTVDAEARPLGA